MYTVKEVANIFKVHQNTVFNWIKAGDVNVVRVGKTIRITEEEVQRLKGR